MTDLISKADAINVLKKIPDGNWKSARFVDEIKRLPAIEPKHGDLVEVVRCKDCKLYEKFKGVKDGGCIYYGIYTDPDDFCSRGEKDG